MHKKVILVHVLLDELLVLLGISTANDEIILRGDKPDELFKPKYFSVQIGLDLLLLKFLEIPRCSLFSMLDSHLGSISCFQFLGVGFLLDLKVPLDVKLG